MPGSTAKKPTNLHSVWDTTILRSMIGRTDITDFADALNEKISDRDATAWAAGPTLRWAQESHDIAEAKVYAGIKEGTTPTLTEKYVADAKPVIEQQLERGGVRLATVLNKSLGSKRAARSVE